MSLQLYQKDILKLAAIATGHGSRSDLLKILFEFEKTSDSLFEEREKEISNSIISLLHRNPLCGDKITLHVNIDEKTKTVRALTHETEACVLCQASATILSQNAVGLEYDTLIKIKDILDQHLINRTLEDVTDWPDDKWNIFKIFHPVSDHKNRYTCVTLPLDALIKLMDRSDQTDVK